jgi:hypothetical protein
MAHDAIEQEVWYLGGNHIPASIRTVASAGLGVDSTCPARCQSTPHRVSIESKSGEEMNNPQKVHSFLKKNLRRGFCDDCVEKKTFVDRHEVNTIASTLALFPQEFSVLTSCREKCSHRDKLVTTAL